MTKVECKLEIELGAEPILGQRVASIKLNGITLFTELVYDNDLSPAERNIVLLFASRLSKLIEDA